MRDALTAAREWGERPRFMLGLAPAGQSEVDRLLMQALVIHDHERCPCGCGFYLDETSGVDGWHGVKTVRCDAKAAMDQWQKDNPNPEPGTIPYVVFDED